MARERDLPGPLAKAGGTHTVPFVAELAKVRDVEYIDLPTGHWPQFTKPEQLAQAILAAVERTTVSPA